MGDALRRTQKFFQKQGKYYRDSGTRIRIPRSLDRDPGRLGRPRGLRLAEPESAVLSLSTFMPFSRQNCGTRIRTWISGARIRCPTIRRSRSFTGQFFF